MNNLKGYAIATDGTMKRIAITYDVVDDNGKVVNQNVKVNRIVTDEIALEHIEYLDSYCKEVIAE